MTGHQLAVGAVLRRGKDVLLISDPPDWALPGGAVEAGEPLLGKVGKEAGYASVLAERLVWVARYPAGGIEYEMLGFEVTGVGPHDGSGAWVPIEEAVERLSQMWFAPIREPAVAFLTGRARVATLWTWTDLNEPPVTHPHVALR
ncbi:NUDIX hydrolase [Dactylosporangium sp. CS-033363]|uniref:NUDIX hydrolase n=1 Tax=Dactylosporangium sp. CS-033363 TaxID=3239935 RepID=UPI003D8A4030